MVISLLVYVFFGKLLPNKETKKSETTEKVDFKPWVLATAIGATVITAFALSFIEAVGWASGFAFGLFAGFITWIVLTSKPEEKARIVALVLVFIVVIFFWMSFHQNGLTLTYMQGIIQLNRLAPLQTFLYPAINVISSGCNSRPCIAS